MEQDFSDWPDQAEAQQITGLSERSLRRVVTKGEIRTTQKRVPGRRPLRLYNREDCNRVRRAYLPADAVKLPSKPKVKKTPIVPVPSVSLNRKVLLTKPEAAAFTGLSAGYITTLLKTRRLPAIKRRGWLIPRVALEQIGQVVMAGQEMPAVTGQIAPDQIDRIPQAELAVLDRNAPDQTGQNEIVNGVSSG